MFNRSRSLTKLLRPLCAANGLPVLLLCVALRVEGQGASEVGQQPALFAQWQATLDRVKMDDCHAPTKEDLRALQDAADGFRQAHDLRDEERARSLLGNLQSSIAKYDEAISNLNLAIKLSQGVEGSTRERYQLQIALADALNHKGDSKGALDPLRAVLRNSQDLQILGEALRLRGETNYYLGKRRLADADFSLALQWSKKAGDLKNKAAVLYDKGANWSDPRNPEGPRQLFHDALKIEDQIGDCRDRAETLADLGAFEEDLGNARNAIDTNLEALRLEKLSSDRDSEAKTLHILAKIHQDVGDLPKALSLFGDALNIETDIGDKTAQGATMVSIDGVYRDMGDLEKARSGYLDTLSFLKDQVSNDSQSQVTALNNLGAVEADMRHPADARKDYVASIKLSCEALDSAEPAYSHWGVGELEEQDALPNYLNALVLAQEYKFEELEGLVSASLMDHYKTQKQPEVAIFFGKIAIHRFQELRKNMGGLNDELMSSFVHQKSETYRTLAGLLIDAGRMKEAQQVLDLLKIQQYSDYMGGHSNYPAISLVWLPIERQVQMELDLLLAHAVAVRKSIDASAAVRKPNGDCAPMTAKLQSAEDELVRFGERLKLRLRPGALRELRPEEESVPQSTLNHLISRDSKTVALYSFLEQDQYRVLLIASSGSLARSVTIPRGDFEVKCEQLLDQIRHHRGNPPEAAKELFTIAFAPVQKEVEQAGAKTLIWYLDGVLRFIPLGALYDPNGKRFLIQDYSIVSYTPLARFQSDKPRFVGARGIAMGTSKRFDRDLPELPNVPSELNSVVTDKKTPHSHGPLPGPILIDEQFTREALGQSLRSQTVIHIASHFVLVPGNDSFSYLLLGGIGQDPKGNHLSLADFKEDHSFHLDGTELVTLSACETGAENKRDDGVVMEGMSEAVLDKNAKAVLSSLWSVNDESTSMIMSRFYALWIGSKGQMTKAEALQRAEIEMIEGHFSSLEKSSNRGVELEGSDSKPRFADPFYWAPFVLLGNWQ